MADKPSAGVLDGAASAREKIDEMTLRIASRFGPEKIVLFGSHARGEGGPGSDADLLVVVAVEGSRRELATEIDLALWGIDLPADVIVVTPEELERDRDRSWTVTYAALREGRVLYERGP